MTLLTKGMGAIIKKLGSKKVINRTTGKPFPQSIQRHMKAADKRHEGMKKAGYKKEPYAMGKKTKSGSIKLKEMWSYNPYKTPKKSKLKKALTSKETKAFGKGALIGGAAASGIEYKRRKDRGDYKK